MSLLESNHRVFNQYISQHGILALLDGSYDFQQLIQQIEPQSFGASFAKRFTFFFSDQSIKKMLIQETKRLFSRFLKEWVLTIAKYTLNMRLMADKAYSPFAPELRVDDSILLANLNQTLDRSKEAEQISKSHALRPIHKSLHPIAMVKRSQNDRPQSAFKVLSGKQLAGELASYFLSIFCGIDFFHCVVPSYCWIEQQSGQKTRTLGALSSFHEGYRTAYEVSCSMSGLKALQTLPDEYVQGICLMHLLRGSEDAHMKNTLIQTAIDPVTEEETVIKIQEIDGEHIMSSSEPRSNRFDSSKNVASLRIWWLGLCQADRPLSEKMLQLILSWSRDKLLELHAQMGLFPSEKIEAQLWRLDQMRTLARQALLEKTPLTARDIFAKLVYEHPTLTILQKICKDPLQIYNQVGSLSLDELAINSILFSSETSIQEAM